MSLRGENVFTFGLMYHPQQECFPFKEEEHFKTFQYRTNGLMHKKTVYKKASSKQNTVKRAMNSGPRKLLYKSKRLLSANKYRPNLAKTALSKANAELMSQKPFYKIKIIFILLDNRNQLLNIHVVSIPQLLPIPSGIFWLPIPGRKRQVKL